jgi:hypothetical protein
MWQPPLPSNMPQGPMQVWGGSGQQRALQLCQQRHVQPSASSRGCNVCCVCLGGGVCGCVWGGGGDSKVPVEYVRLRYQPCGRQGPAGMRGAKCAAG